MQNVITRQPKKRFTNADLAELIIGTRLEVTNLGQRFDHLEQRFDVLEQRFDVLEQRFDGLEQRFDVLEQRLDGLEQRFDVLEQRFDVLVLRVDRLETGQSDLNDRLTLFQQSIQAALSLAVDDITSVLREFIGFSSNKYDNHEKRIYKLERVANI